MKIFSFFVFLIFSCKIKLNDSTVVDNDYEGSAYEDPEFAAELEANDKSNHDSSISSKGFLKNFVVEIREKYFTTLETLYYTTIMILENIRYLLIKLKDDGMSGEPPEKSLNGKLNNFFFLFKLNHIYGPLIL